MAPSIISSALDGISCRLPIIGTLRTQAFATWSEVTRLNSLLIEGLEQAGASSATTTFPLYALNSCIKASLLREFGVAVFELLYFDYTQNIVRKPLFIIARGTYIGYIRF